MYTKVTADCRFHGIGQGLFYSSIISSETQSFSFIYDCGTLLYKNEELLMNEIDAFFAELGKTNWMPCFYRI